MKRKDEKTLYRFMLEERGRAFVNGKTTTIMFDGMGKYFLPTEEFFVVREYAKRNNSVMNVNKDFHKIMEKASVILAFKNAYINTKGEASRLAGIIQDVSTLVELKDLDIPQTVFEYSKQLGRPLIKERPKDKPKPKDIIQEQQKFDFDSQNS